MTTLILFILGFVLFSLALVFLGLEFFIPTHGILAGIAALFAIGAIAAMFVAHSTGGIIAASLTLLAIPVGFFYLLNIYPHTPVGRRVILPTPTPPPETNSLDEFLASLGGQEGLAVTPLRPAGAVEFQGRRIDCVAESQIIEAGARVKVQRVAGTKVIVTKMP